MNLFGDGYYIEKRNHFKSSETARNYCIYYENLNNQKNEELPIVILELDMDKIWKQFEKSGILYLREDTDLIKKNLHSTKYFPDDILIDIGYIK